MPGPASSPTVDHWMSFVDYPTARAWYRAHNGSVVAGYLEHRELAEAENAAERFFMNVVLCRVLYTHALVAAPRISLGWLRPLAPFLGDPRLGMAGIFLQLSRVLPDEYPLRGQRPVLPRRRARLRPPRGLRRDRPEAAAALRVVGARTRSARPARLRPRRSPDLRVAIRGPRRLAAVEVLPPPAGPPSPSTRSPRVVPRAGQPERPSVGRAVRTRARARRQRDRGSSAPRRGPSRLVAPRRGFGFSRGSHAVSRSPSGRPASRSRRSRRRCRPGVR